MRGTVGRVAGGLVLCVLASQVVAADVPTSRPADQRARLNVLLITADDMNYDALGVVGCKTPQITPNLDRFASQSMRFVNAHVTVAVCQPSRSVLMTGRYPCRNGALGFQPIREDVPTLQEQLRAAGYLNGIFGKVAHLAPQGKFCWDTVVRETQLGNGRNPRRYYEESKTFFEKARQAGRPFFLMANSHDPHRPFAGSEPQANLRPRRTAALAAGEYPSPGREYQPDEIVVPPFLPDLPETRREIAQYYGSVHRCDETVGEILRALRESGNEDSTLVMFLSDNGMAFPFAKTNCYLTSTRTPWLVRWPGKVKPGIVNSEDFISGIDFTPTILEAANLRPLAGVDGRSFVPLLRGDKQDGRDHVFTMFHRTSRGEDFPMRAVQDRRFGYIFNAWSDGKRQFRNESRGTPSFRGMEKAAKTDQKVDARVKTFLYRTKDEFYDFQADPAALHNLIDDPNYKDQIAKFRAEMLHIMKAVEDPQLGDFEKLIQ